MFTLKRGVVFMFSKTKRAAILVAASALLATSLGGNIAYADATANVNNASTVTTTNTNSSSDTDVATATNDSVDPNKTVTTTSTNDTTNSNSSTVANTQASYNNIDIASVKMAMLSELNRLRAQN